MLLPLLNKLSTAIPEATPDQLYTFVILLFVAFGLYGLARVVAWYKGD